MSSKRIYTERLVLIPFTLQAARALQAGDKGPVRELGLQATTYWPDQEAIDTFPNIIRKLELVPEPTGFESWMIVLKTDRTVIGDAGFKGQPNAKGEVDIGYSIIAQEHRKGYGMEATRALADWAFRQQGVKHITAKCLLDNEASARILVKLGMQEVVRDDEMIYWSIANPHQRPITTTKS